MTRYYLAPHDGRKSFYEKAHVEMYDKGNKELYSYNTLVAEIVNGELHLLSKWDYSATTLRHVKAFLLQEGFPFTDKNDIARRYYHD